MAEFTSEDLDQGLKENATVISKAKAPFVRSYRVAIAISLIFGTLFVISLIILLIAGQSKWAGLFMALSLATLFATAAPQLARYVRQYGLKRPDIALELPHAPDQYFDEFLSFLQKESGPRAFYISRFRKRRVFLKRQQFFGKLRYFLLSEHSAERAMVMQFRSGLSVPADIFLHRDNVDAILATRKTKRQGGPGRTSKYHYTDAIIGLIGDPRVGTLDLSDRTESVRLVKDLLEAWFKDQVDASGDMPRRDQLAPFAEKIVDHLTKKLCPQGRLTGAVFFGSRSRISGGCRAFLYLAIIGGFLCVSIAGRTAGNHVQLAVSPDASRQAWRRAWNCWQSQSTTPPRRSASGVPRSTLYSKPAGLMLSRSAGEPC